MSENLTRVAIIGTGLMGGSLALALMEISAVEKVTGYDVSVDTRQRARELGVCDSVAETPGEAVEDCDVLFVATPLGSMVNLLDSLAGELRKGVIVSDLGSTKKQITGAIQDVLPEGVHYVGGHPMTGSEQCGVESARAELFMDQYYILTPTVKTDAGAFSSIHRLLTEMGARVISMDPESHDLAMATISHVPHMLALLLMEMAVRQRKNIKNLFTIAAGGFRDMTRIAESNPQMWMDICDENREFIVERLLEYGISIAEMVDVLEGGDRERLAAMFENAGMARRELAEEAGKRLSGLYQVSLPVPDEPGVISRVSTAVGALGINIEDIGIVHPLEGETGILNLRILGEDNARLVADELSGMGYRAGVREV